MAFPCWLRKIRQIISHARSYCTIPLSAVPMISLFHDGGDKMVGDDFRGTNQCPRDEKVYPTLETIGEFTPFG